MTTRNNYKIKSYIFLDTEATGLPGKEVGPTKITEISLIGVSRDKLTKLPSNVYIPRVIDKMNLCIQPGKHISKVASDITGENELFAMGEKLCDFTIKTFHVLEENEVVLTPKFSKSAMKNRDVNAFQLESWFILCLSNKLLKEQAPFDAGLISMIECFLSRFPEPICFIAHNGFQFDFPLLQAELQQLNKQLTGYIVCADTLPGFREVLPNVSFPIDISNTPLTEEERYRVSSDENQLIDQSQCESLLTEVEEVIVVTTDTEGNEVIEITPNTAAISVGVSSKRQLSEGTSQSYRTKRQRVSYKLPDVYAYLFDEQSPNNHRAEDDALTLLKCVAKVGKPMLKWIDDHNVLFSNVNKMW